MVALIFLSVVLVFIILSQNPKGGGLSSTFGGSGTQMFGVRQTNEFMDKATWFLSTSIAILVILSSVIIAKPGMKKSSSTDEPAPVEKPAKEKANTEKK